MPGHTLDPGGKTNMVSVSRFESPHGGTQFGVLLVIEIVVLA